MEHNSLRLAASLLDDRRRGAAASRLGSASKVDDPAPSKRRRVMRRAFASAFLLLAGSVPGSALLHQEAAAAPAAVQVNVNPPRPFNYAKLVGSGKEIVAGPFAPGTSPLAISSITLVDDFGSADGIELVAASGMTCNGNVQSEEVQVVALPNGIEEASAHFTYPTPMIIDGGLFSKPWCLVALGPSDVAMRLGVVGFYR